MSERKVYKNEFVDDISFGEGANSAYLLSISGPIKRGQITRYHQCNVTKRNEQKDAVEFTKGGEATYILKVEGSAKEARITRAHRCSNH
jgi:hypothetical protein